MKPFLLVLLLLDPANQSCCYRDRHGRVTCHPCAYGVEPTQSTRFRCTLSVGGIMVYGGEYSTYANCQSACSAKALTKMLTQNVPYVNWYCTPA